MCLRDGELLADGEFWCRQEDKHPESVRLSLCASHSSIFSQYALPESGSNFPRLLLLPLEYILQLFRGSALLPLRGFSRIDNELLIKI